MTNGTNHLSATHSPTEPLLTPGEALAKWFLDNADRSCDAANDILVAELLQRMRAIQQLLPQNAVRDAAADQ